MFGLCVGRVDVRGVMIEKYETPQNGSAPDTLKSNKGGDER